MEQLLTTEELAEMLKVTRQTVWLWRKEGLPFIKINKAVRFKAEEVSKWIETKQAK